MPETIEWLVIGLQCLEKVNSLTTTAFRAFGEYGWRQEWVGIG